MKKIFAILLLILTIVISLVSCSVYFPKNEPIGIWVCDDPPMTFDFNDGLPAGNVSCVIELNGEEYTFKDVGVPFGENIIQLGAYGEIIEGSNGRFFTQEMSLTYSVNDDKLSMTIINSIYEDYPSGIQLEFEYEGEGKGIIKYP